DHCSVVGLLLVALLREFDNLSVVGGDKAGRTEQVGLAQAPLRHLRRVSLEAEVRPHEGERLGAARLDMAGRDRGDLLLDDDARKQRGHYGGGAVPPRLLYDVEKAVVV